VPIAEGVRLERRRHESVKNDDPSECSGRPEESDADPGALLANYLLRTLTVGESKRFEQWLSVDGQRRVVVNALHNGSIPYQPANSLAPIDVQAWWSEFRPTLQDAPEGSLVVGQDSAGIDAQPALRWRLPVTSPPWWESATVLRVGVAAMLLLAAGLWTARRTPRFGVRAGAESMRTYATARAERAVVALDGARVVLGPESVLRVPETYGQRDRVVSLAGHAYFNVVHDAVRPFRVEAGGAVTEDIGTRFDIRAYANSGPTRIVVAEGTVVVRATGKRLVATGKGAPAVVGAGAMAVADSAEGVRVQSGIAAARYVAWSDGQLTFDDTPLPEAASELGRWYDLDVRLADPRLAAKSLTASFGDDPLSVTLVALEGALGVRAVRTGRVVTLYSP
jgi:transmembrane sensor